MLKYTTMQRKTSISILLIISAILLGSVIVKTFHTKDATNSREKTRWSLFVSTSTLSKFSLSYPAELEVQSSTSTPKFGNPETPVRSIMFLPHGEYLARIAIDEFPEQAAAESNTLASRFPEYTLVHFSAYDAYYHHFEGGVDDFVLLHGDRLYHVKFSGLSQDIIDHVEQSFVFEDK